MTSLEIRFIVHLCSIVVLRLLGLFMMVPLFSVYANNYDGATPLTIGIAMGVYGATQALLHIPLGLLSD